MFVGTYAAQDEPAARHESETPIARSKVSESPKCSETGFSSQIALVARQQETRTHAKNTEAQLQNTVDKLAALCAPNAALTQRLCAIEAETPEEREARKLRMKNAEIEQLKQSVTRITSDTESVRKKLAERQAFLRVVKAQISQLQPPVLFAVKEKKQKRKGKGRRAQKSVQEVDA